MFPWGLKITRILTNSDGKTTLGHEYLLDVAAGTGWAALALSVPLPRGGVTGIDLSSGVLQQARNKAAVRQLHKVDFIEPATAAC